MCGRFVSVSSLDLLVERFAVDEVTTEALEPRWNVAPTQDVYAVLGDERGRRLGTLRWGFVPYWAKALTKGPRPINARIESLAESSMFGRAFERRRCLLPADGFYEWQTRDDGTKRPWFLHDPDDDPLAFAGVWTVWRGPDGHQDPVFSCAIVTTAARGRIADLHDRMPVILPPRLWTDWLTADADRAPHLQDAVARLGPPALVARPVSTRVNNVRNEGPELLDPAEAG